MGHFLFKEGKEKFGNLTLVKVYSAVIAKVEYSDTRTRMYKMSHFFAFLEKVERYSGDFASSS